MNALLFLLAVASASIPQRPVTVDDLMSVRSINDVRIAPDGAHVAYVVSTPSLTKNEHEAALYVIEVHGGEPKRLGESVHILNTPLPAPRLRWSSDSTSIALLGMALDKPQVFSIPLNGNAPQQLTNAAEGVSGFELSPDGKSIAYLSRDPAPAERPIVIHVDAPERPTRIFVKPMSGAARAITPLTHYADSISWSPDSARIAYSAASRTGFPAQYTTRVYTISADGGDARAIVDRPGMNRFPQFSPDGNWIAFITTNGRAEIMASRSLAVVGISGGTPRLFPLNDAWINDIAWAPDSKSVYVTTNDGSFAQQGGMFDQPIVHVPIDGGRVERFALGANFSISMSKDGHLAYRQVLGRSMGDVFVDTTKITDVNPELRELALGAQSIVRWKSFDGMDIYGLLLTPPNFKFGTPVPMITYIHGGPGGGFTHGLFPQFMHTVGQIDPYATEAFASAGYAVLMPMPRGGAGYGEAGQRAIVNAWGEADYKDIMTGIDEMIRRNIADPDRLGVMGASYGGFMTPWIITQTNRFKAAATAASISDLTDLYYLTDAGDVIAEYFGKPWEQRESYLAHSPLTFANRVTTPLLIQHGERDQRTPIAGAWKLYRALKAFGKTVEMDVYPRASHLAYEPIVEREIMRRNLEWFQKWIPTR